MESNVENNNKVDNSTEDNKDNITEDNKSNIIEDKKRNIIENNKSNITEDKKSNVTEDNKAESNDNVENNAEKEREKEREKYLDSFPLKFQPNSSSKKPADDNNLSKVVSKGSSALGGIGVNPAAVLKGMGSDSPPHPFYQDESREPEPKTFDLTRDYNDQKENEQRADQQEQDKIKKDEKVDLSVKPLGNQEIPLPYKPEKEKETKPPIDHSVNDSHKQTEGAKGETVPTSKTTAVHPEGQNAVPKVTKKDKIHATIDKAVGTFKQKIGKIVKNDNLERKGTEKKTEAMKTKEIAKAQKEM